MATIPPIYKAHGKTYHIDTCRPQVQAMEAGNIRLEALSRSHYPGRHLGRSALPGVSSLGFIDAVGEQNWGMGYHRNEGIEICFMDTGSWSFNVEGQFFTLQPGDLTITRPWQAHQLGDPHIRPGRLHWIIIDVNVRRPNQRWQWPSWVVMTKRDLDELTRLLRHNEDPVWHGSEELRRCFQQIAQNIESDKKGSRISHITVYLNEMLLCVLEALRDSRAVQDSDLTSARRTVELFLSDFKLNPNTLSHLWTLDEMARQCGTGITTFVKYCRQITNTTPMQNLNRCRIDAAAKRLVETPKASITDIAMDCGFETSQYFATVFRKFHKCSPNDFRKKNS